MYPCQKLMEGVCVFFARFFVILDFLGNLDLVDPTFFAKKKTEKKHPI